MEKYLCDFMDILESEGRSTSRTIAKLLQISNAESINTLLQLESYGLVVQLNGFWSVLPGPVALRYSPLTVHTKKKKLSSFTNS